MINLKEFGYYADKRTQKIVDVFENIGRQNSSNIPTLLLTGESGTGKTYLAECFARAINAKLLMVQCYPGMTSDNFIAEPNISAIIKKDSQNAVKDGLLVKALKETTDGPTVVLIDEIDKASTETDSFLLDFINSGRVTNGQEEWNKGSGNIWLFLTSNGQRELQEALLNRCRKLEIKRPSKANFLQILELPEDHYLGDVYGYAPTFSIRQAKSYLADLGTLKKVFDEDLLGQYVDLKNHKICSVDELERYCQCQQNNEDEEDDDYYNEYEEDDDYEDYDEDEEVEEMRNINNTQRLNDDKEWIQFISDGNLEKFELEMDNNDRFYIKYTKLSQAKLLLQYGVLSDSEFTLELDDEEIETFSQFQKFKAGKGDKEVGMYMTSDGTIIKYFVFDGKQYLITDRTELNKAYKNLKRIKKPLNTKTPKNIVYVKTSSSNWINFIRSEEAKTYQFFADEDNDMYIKFSTLSEIISLCAFNLIPDKDFRVEVDDMSLIENISNVQAENGSIGIYTLPYRYNNNFKCISIEGKKYIASDGDTFKNIYEFNKEAKGDEDDED